MTVRITITANVQPALAQLLALTRRMHDIAEALALSTEGWACTDCDWKTWEGAELDDDGRCWVCVARIKNEKRSQQGEVSGG